MRSHVSWLRVALLSMPLSLLPVAALAQAGTGSPQAQPDERRAGDYIIHQSVEFGFRYTDVAGAKAPCPAGTADRDAAGLCQDQSMYNTFVNLHTGPRLLEQTLSLRSPRHTGMLFDDMFLSSFGFGGDPNNAARLRLKKHRVYNLNVNFRRDHNFYNYNLFSNPLNNPTGATTTFSPVLNPTPPALPDPSVGQTLIPSGNNSFLLGNSIHWFSTVRRMTDVDLTLAPQSIVSVRLGYNRVRVEGNSAHSFHMPRGTDIQTTMDNDNTSDLYRAGIDFRFLPRTTISYDQFYLHNRTNYSDTDPRLTFLAGGIPVDYGVSWNLPANQPCRATLVFGPGCNLAASFNRQNRYRASTPTEQLSVQSHVGPVDLSGRFVYSHTHMDGTYDHLWNGVTGTARQQRIRTTPQNKRDATEAHIGATIHLTNRLRIHEFFRWFNWRIPSTSVVATTTWGTAGAPVTAPLAAPITAGTFFTAFWKEERKENQLELEYDFHRAVGARLGYRYTNRFVFVTGENATVDPENVEVQPGDLEGSIDVVRQPIHTGLFGIWYRPNEKFRVNFDTEISSASFRVSAGETGTPVTSLGVGNLTRITPRHLQQYRVRANYTPQRWINIGTTVNILESSNNLQSDNFKLHNRNFGISATIMRNERISFDLAYNVQDYLQNNLICAVGTGSFAVGSGPVNPSCPFDISPTTGLPTGLFQVLGRFENVNHFASAQVRWRPVPRLGIGLGYSIVNSDGAETFLNPLMVYGSLKSSFHRPLADVELEFMKNWFARLGWNYYGYNEKGAPGPTQVRDFHANTGTVSLKYAF